MFRFTPACCCGTTPEPVDIIPCIPSCGMIFSGITKPKEPQLVESYRNCQEWHIGLNISDTLSTSNVCTNGVYFDVVGYTDVYAHLLNDRKTVNNGLFNLGNSWVYCIKYIRGSVSDRLLSSVDSGTRYDTSNTYRSVIKPTTFDPGCDYFADTGTFYFIEEYRLPFDYARFPFRFTSEITDVTLPSLIEGEHKYDYFMSPSDCGIVERSKQGTSFYVKASNLETVINTIKSQAQNGMDFIDIRYFFIERDKESSKQRLVAESSRTDEGLDFFFDSGAATTTITFFNNNGNIKSFLENRFESSFCCVKRVLSTSVIPSDYNGTETDLYGTPYPFLNNTTHYSNGHPVSENVIDFGNIDSLPEKWVIADGNFNYTEGNNVIQHYVGDKYDKNGTLNSRFAGVYNVVSHVRNCSSSIPRYEIKNRSIHIALIELSSILSDWTDGGFLEHGGGLPLRKATGYLFQTDFDSPITTDLNRGVIIQNKDNVFYGEEPDNMFWIIPEPRINFRYDTQYRPIYSFHEVDPGYLNNFHLFGKKSGDNKLYSLCRCFLGGNISGSAMPNTGEGTEYTGGNQYIRLIGGKNFHNFTEGSTTYTAPTIDENDVQRFFSGYNVYAPFPYISRIGIYEKVFCLVTLSVSMLALYGAGSIQ